MGNITNSGAIVFKAGANVSTSIPEGLGWVTWISEAQAFINSKTRFNWVDDFDSLNDDVKHILSDTAAAKVAVQAIAYDMSGYTSRGEAESMINVQKEVEKEGLRALEDEKNKDFVQGA